MIFDFDNTLDDDFITTIESSFNYDEELYDDYLNDDHYANEDCMQYEL